MREWTNELNGVHLVATVGDYCAESDTYVVDISLRGLNLRDVVDALEERAPVLRTPNGALVQYAGASVHLYFTDLALVAKCRTAADGLRVFRELLAYSGYTPSQRDGDTTVR